MIWNLTNQIAAKIRAILEITEGCLRQSREMKIIAFILFYKVYGLIPRLLCMNWELAEKACTSAK